MTVDEFASNAGKILREMRNEGDECVITDGGQAVARIAPVPAPREWDAATLAEDLEAIREVANMPGPANDPQRWSSHATPSWDLWLSRIDDAAEAIGEVWPRTVSAADAVAAQRR